MEHFSVSSMPPLEIPKGIFDTYRLNTKLKEKIAHSSFVLSLFIYRQ